MKIITFYLCQKILIIFKENELFKRKRDLWKTPFYRFVGQFPLKVPKISNTCS